MKKTLAIISTLSLALVACTGSKNTPAIETYSFTPVTISATDAPVKNTVLRITPAAITPQFSNYSFIYRISDTQYLVDPYRQFLTAPSIEITSYLKSQLAPSLNSTLISTDSLMSAQFILQENITEFYADYQHKSAPEAVISVQFILYHCENGVTKQAGTLTLSEKTRIEPNNPTSLLKGYQSDLDKMTKELSSFINKHLN